jgi:uncharacterized protein YybS (DUF2232 family)
MNLKSSTGHDLQLRIKAALLGVVGSFVLFATYLAIPVLGICSGIFAPFPAAYNRLVNGRLSALIVVLGAATAITAVFGVFNGCQYVVLCAMTGLLMPELIKRGVRSSHTLIWTTAANLLVLAAGLVFYSLASGINLQQMVFAEISGSMKQAIAIYEQSGVKGEELDLIKHSVATASELLQRLYPALVTAILVVIAGCNLVLLKKVAAKTSLIIATDDFCTFRNPDLLVWALITSGFFQLLPDSLLTIPLLNILTIIGLMYLFQGLAVIATLFNRNSVPAMLRYIFYTLLVFQPYLLVIVAGIGLFDLWGDFRTPKKQENL